MHKHDRGWALSLVVPPGYTLRVSPVSSAGRSGQFVNRPGYAYRFTASVALCPPNPKELLRTKSTIASLASFGT